MVCCLFCRFPVRNALRASQAVLITDVMVNVKNISLDKKAFKKNNTATTKLLMDQSYAHRNLSRHLTLITLKLIELLSGAMAETFSCNINWGENLDSRSYVKCFSDSKIMAISNENNWLYFWRRRQGCLYLKNVL